MDSPELGVGLESRRFRETIGAHAHTLNRALRVVVAKERLAAALDVKLDELEDYLSGKQPMPHKVFR